MADILALKVNDKDNVATIFANDVKAGMSVNIRDKKGNSVPEKLRADIPYGHKVAVKPIKKGEPIIKYGEEIGVAIADILVGDYVHVHNLDSQRARGDLEGQEV
ncbi:MAG: D-galactarate dehydratase [Clostridia bacterium]|jgi:altronate dehydratase small subunit|nr:UxaA family hydrolase [Lachnospiraceae bacterium]NCB99369.1 D-galactarate dehydratase [Clostridia bacterium]NCD01528.1 D-galactarate dehydratase [Clostridia bacterium]